MRCVSQLDSTASQMFKQFAILPPKMPKLIHVNPSFHLWGGSIAGVEHQQLGYLHTFAIPGYWMVEKRRAEDRIPTWPVEKVVMYYTQCHKPTIWGWFESHHISSICIIPMVFPWFPMVPHGRLRGIERIVASSAAFAAMDRSGRVVTWGYPMHGGDSSSVTKDSWDHWIPLLGGLERCQWLLDVSWHKKAIQELQGSRQGSEDCAGVQDSALLQPMRRRVGKILQLCRTCTMFSTLKPPPTPLPHFDRTLVPRLRWSGMSVSERIRR